MHLLTLRPLFCSNSLIAFPIRFHTAAPSRSPASSMASARPRSDTLTDPDFENVIRPALAGAQAAGWDHLAQTETAVSCPKSGHQGCLYSNVRSWGYTGRNR